MLNKSKKTISLKQKLKTFFAKKSACDFAFQSYQSYYVTPGKPVWSGRDYRKFSDEGYIKNVIAHRAISMISASVSLSQ